MRGGGVWADTATGLQGIENWLNAHPALLSLLKNTGNLAAGATWLKNFTPAGIVIGLVTNYGYEKVLQLMEGRMDVAKEALSSYFKAHDKDITQEQASYLANFSMEVLQAAGQVAVHQVAAKRFNAVKKGAGKAAKAAKVEGVAKGGCNKIPVGRRGNPLNVVRGTNVSTIINGRKFTGHALDKMQGRGFTPTIVEEIIKHPTKIISGKQPGTTVYIGEKLKVVLNEAADIITVIPQ